MITALTDPSQLPNQLQDQQTFDANMAYVIDMLPERARQENELAANMGMFAAGGAYAFPYVFDSSTVDSDPGVGKLRLGSTTQNAATVIRMDVQIVGGTDISNVLADLRAATSAVKGSIRVVKMVDPSKWMIFDVTQVALPSGYRNLTVTARATGGGSASPFANGDALMVYIDRNGDSGTVPGATELLAEMNVTTQVAALAFPNVFDSAHDWYLVDIENMQGAISAQEFSLRFYFNGLEGANTAYVFGQVNTEMSGLADRALLSGADASSLRGLLQVRGINSSVRKSIMFDGESVRSAGGVLSSALRGAYTASNNPSGFGIRTNGIGFSSALIRVYGVRKV